MFSYTNPNNKNKKMYKENKSGAILKQYIVVIIANFTLLQMGLTTSWLSPVLVKLMSVNETVLREPITESQGAWIASVGSLMSLAAVPFSGLLANRYGRKKAMILGVVPKMVMGFFFIFATDVWMILFGRCLCGLSDFMAMSVTATYSSEIASKEIRGGLGTLSQILSALGAMIMLTMGPFVSYVTLNIVLTCIIIVTFVPLMFLPETPYFLYSKGRKEEALVVLDSIRNGKAEIDDELKEYSENNDTDVKFNELFRDKVIFKTFGKAIVIAIGAQLVGYNAISLNLQTIFNLTNTTVRSEVSSAIIGCIELLACFCTILLTDKFGRKPVLGTFLIGMAIGMIGLGTFFTLTAEGTKIVGFLNYLPLISIIVVVFSYNAGIGSLLWMQIAELFDGNSRAVGVSSGALAGSIAVFLIIRFFPSITSNIGPAATFWIFSGLCVLFCMFILFCVPETKGRSFSDIQRSLRRKT